MCAPTGFGKFLSVLLLASPFDIVKKKKTHDVTLNACQHLHKIPILNGLPNSSIGSIDGVSKVLGSLERHVI